MRIVSEHGAVPFLSAVLSEEHTGQKQPTAVYVGAFLGWFVLAVLVFSSFINLQR